MAHLSHETLVTQAAITVIVDNLEERGFVKRSRNGEDRRVIKVEITSKGKSMFKEALGTHRRFVEEMLDGLTDDELESFTMILDKLVTKVDSFAINEKGL